jgi:hypothetical protein
MKRWHGVEVYDIDAQRGVNDRRRNPRKKARLPYHARKHLTALPIMGRNAGPVCAHALAQHEEVVKHDGTINEKGIPFGRYQTVSYALPCLSKHSSKKVQHRDITGRKW